MREPHVSKLLLPVCLLKLLTILLNIFGVIFDGLDILADTFTHFQLHLFNFSHKVQ